MDNNRELIPPPLLHEFHEREGRRWLLLALHILAAMIVATAVVFAARTIYRSAVHKPVKTQTMSQKTRGNNKQSPKTSGSSKPVTSSPPTTSLPNNGPGNVAVIFTVSAVAAGGLHYAVMHRRRGA
ncbi:MAG: hypothetical protein ABSD10_03365 [Candidatus Saccharimonadales bacterium]